MWLDTVKKKNPDLTLNWRNFSLQQVNAKDPGEWRVWNETDLVGARSLMASIAGRIVWTRYHPFSV